MKLVVVESPKKARTIGGFLGAGYRVAASMGHVRDLPPKALGVDVTRDFAPAYEVLPGAKKALATLRKAAAGAESVLLATDPDREGEAIAWHVAEALRLPKRRYHRITFHEISRRAIQEALASPRHLDPHLIDAQQARRVLDRLVGYQLSPLLWRKVQRGTSAGRVQSVAVRIVIDREREIDAFVPEEYWTIDVRLSPLTPQPPLPPGERRRALPLSRKGRGARGEEDHSFLARLQEVDGKKAEIKDEATARLLEAQLRAAAYQVRETAQKTVTRQPFPPFTTSTLQQAAGIRLRLQAKRTMALAQGLYEAGLITYMRTDSVAISSAAISQARQVVAAQFGPEYVPETPRRYSTKTKNAQEAHEAIRPVDVAKLPATVRTSLAPDEWRLYDLIWKRMVASQMTPARYLQDVVIIDATYREDLTPGPFPAREGERRPPVSRSAPTVASREEVSERAPQVAGVPPSLGGKGARGLGPHRFTLKAQATVLTFAGWLAAYGEEASEGPAPARRQRRPGEADQNGEADAPANDRLPHLEAGQQLRMEDVLPAQHFTQPPRRYSEASLVKALEEAGVGRPSTYAAVVSTIQDRGYVRLEQRHFVPTELGYAANDFLVAHFPRIVDLPFTAEMEDSLDEIAGGRLGWTEMLHTFYGSFAETVARASGAALSDLKLRERAAGDGSVIRGERSGAGDRVRKQGRVGALVPSKSATTAAGNRATRGTRGTTACPQCGKPLVQRVSQFGPFWGCSGYPACRYIHRDPGTAPRAASSAATPTGDNGGGDVPTKPPQQSKRPRRPPGTLTKHVVRANRERRPTSR